MGNIPQNRPAKFPACQEWIAPQVTVPGSVSIADIVKQFGAWVRVHRDLEDLIFSGLRRKICNTAAAPPSNRFESTFRCRGLQQRNARGSRTQTVKREATTDS